MVPELHFVYKVSAVNKLYEYWQRDSLTIELYTLPVAMQKLNYIHNNPLVMHWQLCYHAPDNPYSSALYYAPGEDKSGFLYNLFDHFYR